MSELLVATLSICGAHDLGEVELTDSFEHAVDLVVLLKAVNKSGQLFDVRELFYGLDPIPKFNGYLLFGKMIFVHS